MPGRNITKEEIQLPIINDINEKVGTISIEVTFKLLSDKSGLNCYDWQKMMNKEVAMTIDFVKVEFEIEVPYAFITFCGVTPGYQCISNKDNNTTKMELNYIHEFHDAYQIEKIKVTNAFHRFMSAPGIQFNVWVPVFSDLTELPPIIAYKLNSKKVTLHFKTPENDDVKLIVRTGNRVNALKRKLEYECEIPEETQELIYENETMEDNKTLIDYGVTNNSTITIKLKKADPSTYGNKRASRRLSLLDDLLENEEFKESDENNRLSAKVEQAISKEMANPNLSEEERKKLRRVKNRSIHLAMVYEDKTGNSGPMTVESLIAENKKLKDELTLAQNKIKSLERSLAEAQTKAAAGTTKAGKSKKILGSWRKEGQTQTTQSNC